MVKISKFTALRLFSILMFPYSANAAAGCLNTDLDYSQSMQPDYAYEAAAYSVSPAACFAGTNSESANISDNSISI